MTLAITILVWLPCAAFTFWACTGDLLRSFGRITRGDLAFITLLALIGPVGLGAGIVAMFGGRGSKFWSKRVWPK